MFASRALGSMNCEKTISSSRFSYRVLICVGIKVQCRCSSILILELPGWGGGGRDCVGWGGGGEIDRGFAFGCVWCGDDVEIVII